MGPQSLLEKTLSSSSSARRCRRRLIYFSRFATSLNSSAWGSNCSGFPEPVRDGRRRLAQPTPVFKEEPMAVMKMKAVTIDVSFIPRTVNVTALSLEDNQQYTYSGTTRRASKSLQEIM